MPRARAEGRGLAQGEDQEGRAPGDYANSDEELVDSGYQPFEVLEEDRALLAPEPVRRLVHDLGEAEDLHFSPAPAERGRVPAFEADAAPGPVQPASPARAELLAPIGPPAPVEPLTPDPGPLVQAQAQIIPAARPSPGQELNQYQVRSIFARMVNWEEATTPSAIGKGLSRKHRATSAEIKSFLLRAVSAGICTQPREGHFKLLEGMTAEAAMARWEARE